jgi:hypothetical protein
MQRPDVWAELCSPLSDNGAESEEYHVSMNPPPPPPSPPGGGFGQYASAEAKPDNYLVFAILSTVLCCLPLGVVSIVYAAQVDGKWNGGDRVGARESADKAKTFAIASAVVGLVGAVLYIALAT